MRLSTFIVSLTTLFASNAMAGMPEDWIVRGDGPIVDGKIFSLCSEDQGGCLRIKDRTGANIGWTQNPNNFMRIERASGGDQPLKCGENFALFIHKEFLIYEKQTFGINLSSRTKNNGYYQWKFDCGSGEVPTNQPLVLKNGDNAIVGCRRTTGVNICWAGDVLTLPAIGNVREADKDKVTWLKDLI